MTTAVQHGHQEAVIIVVHFETLVFLCPRFAFIRISLRGSLVFGGPASISRGDHSVDDRIAQALRLRRRV